MKFHCNSLLLLNAVVIFTYLVIQVFIASQIETHLDLTELTQKTESRQEEKNVIQSNFRVVYAVSCDGWQLIQSLALDYSWEKVKQAGTLTRLVTGCEQKEEKWKKFMKTTSITTDRFDVQFFDAHDHLPNEQKTPYKQYNRPFALREWLDRVQFSEEYLVILDPDFIFLKSFDENKVNVTRGQPVSQKYSLSAVWLNWIEEICGKDCKKWEWLDSVHHFEAGVPYIWHKLDLRKMLDVWIEYIPKTFKKYDRIESDMYAYALAAGKLHLKHELGHNWQSTCMKNMEPEPNDKSYMDNVFIHYCARYEIGDFIWTKHWTKARGNQLWLFECDSPILYLPKFDKVGPKEHKHLWAIEKVMPLINEALIAYKKKNCINQDYNLNQTIVCHEATQETHDKLYHEMGKPYPPW